jgi:cytochrome c
MSSAKHRRQAWLIAMLPLVLLASTATASNASRGGALIAGKCAACHATGRTGTSPNPRAPLFRELHGRYPVENLSEALAEGIMIGHPEMPQFRFAPRQVRDIIAYLKSIQTPDTAPRQSPP